MTQAAAEVGASALSCLTANLSTYLASTMDDPFGRIARSIRLAVRFDPEPVFSHHRHCLARLDDGRRLAYQGADDPAIAVERLADQIDRYAGVLALAYAGAMPWSLAEPANTAVHLVLLTGHSGQSWLVSDAFSALLPAGPQKPFAGWIGTPELLRALRTPAALTDEQRNRIRYAFGPAVRVPRKEYRWLEPGAEDAADVDPQWIDDPDVALPKLAGFFARLPDREQYIDDLWAATQHHTFRYAHLRRHHPLTDTERAAVDAATTAWSGLPMSLHFAADSARRGKPRPSLVSTAFQTLRSAELRCAPLLVRLDYAVARDGVRMKGEQ